MLLEAAYGYGDMVSPASGRKFSDVLAEYVSEATGKGVGGLPAQSASRAADYARL
eukprot:CAMPEP_0177620104 /NCGR_PEP_ID=MMETSP0419_2-20121207/26681_1 /TAXON_ID=582737 /ORGANISM="Tetraselmis sp., Strain GSL018" /LENGTH=54 /DNA_ID=CAMNT_0019119547 /DNA_START=873 /DNA_END=1033 /DNA_ORIENTATION=+